MDFEPPTLPEREFGTEAQQQPQTIDLRALPEAEPLPAEEEKLKPWSLQTTAI